MDYISILFTKWIFCCILLFYYCSCQVTYIYSEYWFFLGLECSCCEYFVSLVLFLYMSKNVYTANWCSFTEMFWILGYVQITTWMSRLPIQFPDQFRIPLDDQDVQEWKNVISFNVRCEFDGCWGGGEMSAILLVHVAKPRKCYWRIWAI
jgi:hypothetical protein